jgi:hypothetical protein
MESRESLAFLVHGRKTIDSNPGHSQRAWKGSHVVTYLAHSLRVVCSYLGTRLIVVGVVDIDKARAQHMLDVKVLAETNKDLPPQSYTRANPYGSVQEALESLHPNDHPQYAPMAWLAV